jgi:hypothetical protein
VGGAAAAVAVAVASRDCWFAWEGGEVVDKGEIERPEVEEWRCELVLVVIIFFFFFLSGETCPLRCCEEEGGGLRELVS